MTIAAKSVIQRAATLLTDKAGDHWPTKDLVVFFNEGQRVIATVRPDTTAATIPHTLVAGERQVIPATAQAFIEVTRNTGSRKRAVTQADVDDIDAVEPVWRNRPQGAEVIHFMHDLAEPRVFDVYPPVKVGTQVQLRCSMYPIDISTNLAEDATFDAVTGDMSLADQFAEPLLDYVLYRAFDVDAQFGNKNLSAAHLAACEGALGVQLKASSVVAKT